MEVKPGYKRTEVGIIPQDWEIKPLDSVSAVTSGKRLPLGRKLTNRETPHPYIRVTDMGGGSVSLNDIRFVPADVFPSIKRYRIYKEDLYISVAGTLGLVGRIPKELDGANLTENADMITNITCSKDFLLYVLMSPLVQDVVDSIHTVGAQPKLALTRIRKFQIPLPPTLAEQEAIAEALSDADALIDSLEQLIAKKRYLKQGAMQDLLTGKKRLPGFDGEWETKALSQLVELTSSGIYGVEDRGEGRKAMPVATTAHISDDDQWNSKVMKHRYFTADQIENYGVVENDLVVVKSSGSAASIKSGKIGLVGKIQAGTFIFSNFLMVLRPTSIFPRFLYCYLTSFNVKSLLPSLVEASTYPNIRINEYLALDIPVPPITEQTAIAAVLSDMDAEITALEAKLAKARQVKQGMMQELLIGRTRLVEPEVTHA